MPGKDRRKNANCLDIPWSDTLGSKSIPVYADQPLDSASAKAIRCLSCIASTQDSVVVGSFVYLKRGEVCFFA